MKNIKEVYEEAKKKSRKPIKVEYKGKIYKIDLLKLGKKLGSYALTATLVITAVSYGAPKLKQAIGIIGDKIDDKKEEMLEDLDEKKYQASLEKAFNRYEKSIIDCISIPVDPITKRYDYDKFYEYLATNSKLDPINLDAYIQRYGEESAEINNTIRKMTGSDPHVYLNLNDYLNSRGFESYKDFRNSCIKLYDQKFFSNFSSQVEQQDQMETYQEKTYDNIEWVKAILESEKPDVEIYKAYQHFGDSDETNEIVSKISFMDKETYSNLEEYVIAKGFNSMDEWKAYCASELTKGNEERGMAL